MDEKKMPREENNQEMRRDTASDRGHCCEDKPFGPLVGIVIIVIILILGGLYFWGQRTGDGVISDQDTVVEALETQSLSDEIVDIEADLDATDLESLDADLSAIEDELDF